MKGPGEKGPEDEPEPQAAERESPVETVSFYHNRFE